MRRDVAVILLYDKEKRILLQHRTDDAKRLPGYWAFFGGGIFPGETPEQAVKREAKEELEYTLKNPKKVMEQELGSGHTGTMHVFMEEYDSSQELILREGKDMNWKKLSETKKLKMVKHDREVLEEIAGRY